MININLRLQKIADLIEDDSFVVDVGCDHGLLDIYLSTYKNCHCLATDISSKCLFKAKNIINKYNLNDKIITQVTNGLENIDYNSYDYVVIAGMGFQTIKDILDNKSPKKLIIQSNNNIEELKKYLYKKYKLIDEIIVYENKIYYVILKLELGKYKYHKNELIIGSKVNDKNYIKYLYNKNKDIYKKIPSKYLIKKLEIKHKLRVLKKALFK